MSFVFMKQYFPEQMVDIKMPTDESLGFMTRYERYKNVLLQVGTFVSLNAMPDPNSDLKLQLLLFITIANLSSSAVWRTSYHPGR